MDHIATELGISKKTIYQYFSNKQDLVYKTMSHYIELEQDQVNQIEKQSDNAIDELFNICDFICTMLRERNPSLLFDLRKYHPESWRIFLEHKHGFVYEHIVNNIKKGIKEGLFLKDFDIEVISKLYISRIESMIDNELFPFRTFPLTHVKDEMLYYHVRGIATEKGLKHLELMKKRA